MANQPKKYKKFVATAATATLVASAIVPVASAASFSDVSENNEFAPYIDALTEAGIINGYPSTNTFKPGAALTRGQVVKMLGRWVESNGVEIPSDWNTKARFTDVPTNHKDQELVKYAALVADEGVFGGAAGKLMAGNNITRQQMAKVLNGAYAAVNGESLIEIAEGVDNVRIPDLSSARAEFEDAIQALMDLEISSTNSGNFRPLENVTRAQFSKFLYNTINFEAVDVAPFEVKAVNSTTVEVIFDQDIENIDKVKFAIEGLDIKGAVVKQTSKRTAVLTTSEQKGGTEYTVTVDGEKAGTFVGIAAVIPTAIKVNTQSVQGVIGEEVTLSAAVTVPEGQSKEGVSVTFNIVNNQTTNEKIEVEAFTNAEGVATYKYTRYYASEDNVAAYATKKSSVVSQGKVYWANKIQLAVAEITAGNELANETKKSYKVTGAPNSTYYIAIKENLNVAPDKITNVKVQNSGNTTVVTPYELTTGATQFATVTTNSNGEGTFTIYGSNLSATPIVYKPESTPTTPATNTYNALDLQAAAPTVKFSQVDRLAIKVAGEGTADSAAYTNTPVSADGTSVGGRNYTVTVTDKDGKLAPEGTVAYVKFKVSENAGDSVYFSTDNGAFELVNNTKVYSVKVGKEGKAQFRVAGKGPTSYVTPTVFLNTAGTTNPVVLDTTDVQAVAETTYFKTPVVTNATLKVTDQYGRAITSLNAGQDAYFTYQSVDQNGFAYRPAAVTSGSTTQLVWVPVYGQDAQGNTILLGYEQKTVTVPGTSVQEYTLVFDVTSSFGDATVKNAAGTVLTPATPSQNLGNTKTYQVKSDAEGKAIVRVTSTNADTVSVNVTGANNILPTQTASVSFANTTAVPNAYTGVVKSFNVQNNTITFADKNPVELFGQNTILTAGNGQVYYTPEEFIELLEDATGAVTITRTVNNGVVTFNVVNVATNTGTAPVNEDPAVTLNYANISGTVGTPLDVVNPTITGLPVGSTVTYSANALPTGVTLNPTTGALTVSTSAVIAPTTITVSATYTLPYGGTRTVSDTVNVAVAAPSTDTTITGITVADVAAVKGTGNSYTVTVPTGTTVTAASFKVATTHAKAKAVATESTTTQGTWEVVVTAEDGTTKATYTVVVTTS